MHLEFVKQYFFFKVTEMFYSKVTSLGKDNYGVVLVSLNRPECLNAQSCFDKRPVKH